MLRDAIEKKKTALFLLASAQSDVEIHASYLIKECGLKETIRFYDAHHDDIGDHHTAIGRFIKVVSHTNISCPAVDRQGPVGCPILLLPLMSHHCHLEACMPYLNIQSLQSLIVNKHFHIVNYLDTGCCT